MKDPKLVRTIRQAGGSNEERIYRLGGREISVSRVHGRLEFLVELGGANVYTVKMIPDGGDGHFSWKRVAAAAFAFVR